MTIPEILFASFVIIILLLLALFGHKLHEWIETMTNK
jgi:hypothetical protein